MGRNVHGACRRIRVTTRDTVRKVASAVGRAVAWLAACTALLVSEASCRCDLGSPPSTSAPPSVSASAGDNSSHPGANAMPSSAINERGRRARMVSADDGGTCVISSGNLYCWGAPLGNEEFWVPFRLAPSGMRFDHVSRAGGHVCARTADGQAWCAGRNSYGELGGPSVDKCGVGPFRDGTVEYHPCSQLLLRVPEIGPVVDVVAGVNRTCAILDNGRVSCWGAHHEAREQPLQARSARQIEGLSNVAQLALGDFFGCALLTDGTVRCWGSNQQGQLGQGNSDDSIRNAAQRVSGVDGAVAISAGSSHACAVSNGVHGQRLHCWGSSLRGQIGMAEPCDKGICSQPISVALPEAIGRIRDLALGGQTTCALSEDGSLYCMGEQAPHAIAGQLRKVAGVPSLVSVAIGGSHITGISHTGVVLSWGETTLRDEAAHTVKCDGCASPLIEVPGITVASP